MFCTLSKKQEKTVAYSAAPCYNLICDFKRRRKRKDKERKMKYECTVCGYVYDEDEGEPDNGIEPGTAWEEIPDSFTCPICGVEKADFEPVE